MEVRIRPGRGKQTEAFARFHRVVCDQPFDEGGTDIGMTPPELMLSSLGCCAMHYAVEFLRARHLAVDHLELHVSAAKSARPVRLTDIAIQVDAPGLTAKARDGLMAAIKACILHRTLAGPAGIDVSMTTSVAEGPVARESERVA